MFSYIFFPNINNPIVTKALTTEADSLANPRPADGPYVPYDFSQMSVFDIIAYTINNGGAVMIFAICFFFVMQNVAHHLLGFVFGDTYKKKRTVDQQREDCIRVCSIINGLIAVPSACMFFSTFVRHGFQIHSYHYQTMEGYDFNRGFITGYFIWDIIVCVRYNWGFLWTTHGIFSFLGCFLLNFPVSDHIGCYFTGMFELTNGLLHSSAILRNFNVGLGVASIMEYVFAFFYLLIRVIGGTYCAYAWMTDMRTLWVADMLHSKVAVGFVWFSVSTIMILQYVWFWEIVQLALGLKKRDMAAEEGKGKKPKQQQQKDLPAGAQSTRNSSTVDLQARNSTAAPTPARNSTATVADNDNATVVSARQSVSSPKQRKSVRKEN